MKHKYDWHGLKAFGIGYFRHKAGYIPPVMPVDHDWIGDLPVTVKMLKTRPLWYKERLKYNALSILFTTVCDGCVYHMKNQLPHDAGTVNYYSELKDFDTCELCGKLGIESELPF